MEIDKKNMNLFLFANVILIITTIIYTRKGVLISIYNEKKRKILESFVLNNSEKYDEKNYKSLEEFGFEISQNIEDDMILLIVSKEGDVAFDTSGLSEGNILNLKGIKSNHFPIKTLINKGMIVPGFSTIKWNNKLSLGCSKKIKGSDYTVIAITNINY